LKDIQLSLKTEVLVRFSEVDTLRIVWHGNYVKYLEDGREAFGRKYGLGYLDYIDNNLLTPIVKVDIDYKYPLYYGDKAIVETTYVDNESAKIIFDYKIYRASDNVLVSTARTIQVFLNINRELQLTMPPFFEDWKRKWGFLVTGI
jgi:acyl-CoA thioester hydrolase